MKEIVLNLISGARRLQISWIKKTKIIAMFISFFILPAILISDDIVNIKYITTEKKASISYRWEYSYLEIKSGSKNMKLLLNYPYIIYNNKIVRIDNAPFVSNGDVFISEYALSKISGIIEEPEETPVVEVALTAIPTEPSVPVIKKRHQSKNTYKPVQTEVEPAMVPVQISNSKKQNIHEKLIVLDPGHGGKDPGAQANGINEKDITLDVALRVMGYLRDYNVGVLITRDTDNFITLKERAEYANKKRADLFVSIHCNYSYEKDAKGIRTYIYSRTASSKEAAEAAKAENKTVNFFEFLLNDLRKGAFEYLSVEAAGYIQRSVVAMFKQKWAPTERAPFYVIANTSMPSVLVEIGFISNYKEAQELQDNIYRDKLAKTIAEGIMDYIGKTTEMQAAK